MSIDIHSYIHMYNKPMEMLARAPQRPLYSRLKAWGVKPLVLDFYMQRVWPTFSLERILARVTASRPAAQNAVTLRLRPNFNFKNFEAGQHVLVTMAVNGQRLTRTYSPTLLSDGSIEITIKQVEGGRLSGHLARFAQRGSTVEVSRPFGEMTWSRLPISSHYVFCAGGVGITPLRSLLRFWDENAILHSTRSIDLHYWAKTEADFCFKDEFRAIANRRPGLELHFHASDQAKVRLQDAIDKEAETVLACGPEGFVREAHAVAESLGQKFFGEHTPASGALNPTEQGQEAFFEVTYDGQIIHASSRKTILESLEERGLTPVHGCRMGLCKSCTCFKTSGSTFNSRDQALAVEPGEEIQICVSRPRSALHLEKY